MIREEFKEFPISKEIIDTLDLLGYKHPTPIQKKAIMPILEGKDVVAKSQTGSGKTAAFGIPLCEQIVWEERYPQVLVLEPTRELALQVKEELFQIGRKKRMKVPAIFGGMPIQREINTLKQKSHIVVGTPGRVMDHIRRGTFVLEGIRSIVIDEADLMLDMGFIDEVGEILKAVLKEREQLQMSLFSATLEERIQGLVDAYMKDPVFVEIASDTKTADSVTQIAYEAEEEDKFQLLMDILVDKNPKDCMIFCATREMVQTLCYKLQRKKVRCEMLHGGMEQRKRLYAIADFRKGKYHYLITTDVSARGIDFDDMELVINYDFPSKKENYVHRIGRTGRKGNKGTAISLISSREKQAKKAVERYIEMVIPVENSEDIRVTRNQKDAFEMKQKEKVLIKQGKEAAFKSEITKLNIGGGKKSKMRAGDIVGAICNIKGINQEDIGVIDIRDSFTYVEILNGKGDIACGNLQSKTIKGKIRKVRKMKL